MTKEKFTKLVKRYLVILENPNINKKGEHELKIYGFDNLYDKLFPNDNVCHCHIPKPDPFTANSICENCGGDIFHNKLEEEKIQISRELLESIRNNSQEYLQNNIWRKHSSKSNKRFLEQLENEILQIDELLSK